MNEPEPQLPDVADVLVSTTASLVNLAGIRLTEKEHRNPAKAKEAIDAARELLPLCPEEAVGPIKDALAQLQMLYVKETQNRARSAEPSASGTQNRARSAEPSSSDADERAKARSKIWTPPGS
ncbi:MAG: hypothetical protein H0T69_06860 [Thermoleophilaceae bacterium]|nr:hypothetical protein [Thermoleophilaceae bacterium]